MMGSMQQLRVIRPNRRRLTSRVVAHGTLAELEQLAARGGVRTGDLVVGLRTRPVPAHEVPELAPYVPCEEEARLAREVALAWPFTALGVAYVLLVFVLSGSPSAAQWLSLDKGPGTLLALGAFVLLPGALGAATKRNRLRLLRRAALTARD